MAERLDTYVVAHGLVASRSRARDLILRALVTVDGVVVDRPAHPMRGNERVVVDETAAAFVSRGAEKLVAALDVFQFDPAGRACLDLGSSTGGFVQVLLARGAARVVAVDVGTGQLHPRIAADARVFHLEQTDARKIAAHPLECQISAVTADLSFISLTKAIGPALALAAAGAWLVALVKPQYELGPEAIGKGGIVRDAGLRAQAVQHIANWIEGQQGWRIVGQIPSPIDGGDGNVEFLLGAVRDGVS